MSDLDADFLLLRIAQLKGMASPELLRAAASGVGDGFEERLARLVSAGWLQPLPRGVRVTPAGRDWLSQRLREESQVIDRDASACVYDSFGPVNQAFKQLIYDWQIRVKGGAPVPNDHQDAAYDQAVLARLEDTHRSVQPVLDAASAIAPRLAMYEARLAAARQRVAAGETRWLAAPLVDSYHTVWFELHEDLLAVAGLTRSDEARAGRAD